MKKYNLVLIVILTLIGASVIPTVNGLNKVIESKISSEFESFEEGFGPWTPKAHMPDTLEWFISRTQETAYDGEWSLNYTADGSFDWGAVWMQREINLTNGTWDVNLEFYVSGGADTPINAWAVISYIGFDEPEVWMDFTTIAYIENKSWSLFDYQKIIELNVPKTIWVAFGFRINWETWRTYYFDSVTISGIPDQDNNCGDVNDDNSVDIDDIVYLINFIFSNGVEPLPQICIGDVNYDEQVDIDDVVYLINYIFAGGLAPVDDCCG